LAGELSEAGRTWQVVRKSVALETWGPSSPNPGGYARWRQTPPRV